eukprot:6741573-Pyramimonas_sp.AAC.1
MEDCNPRGSRLVALWQRQAVCGVCVCVCVYAQRLVKCGHCLCHFAREVRASPQCRADRRYGTHEC